MDLSLEQRLLRFLAREEEDERRSSEDLRALAVEDRVLEGECIQNAQFASLGGNDNFAFDVSENLSKFRAGDALLVGDGTDFAAAHSLVYGRYDASQKRLVTRTRQLDPSWLDVIVDR